MFRIRLKFIVALLIWIYICFPLNASAYDDEKTHPDITEKAARTSILNNYLSSNLGFTEGLEKSFKYNNENLTILKWLRKGSTAEDSPMCQASNHFHNPLKPWDQSYMTDVNTALGLVPQIWCYLTDWPQSERKSLATWGTGYLSPAPNGTKIAISKQEWGWDNARSYYYLALTSAVNTDREKYFANTFQALGQVLHLIEDGAQPAHMRDDFESHLKFIGFESIDPRRWFGSKYEHYIKTHADLVTNAIPSVLPSFTRLTDFWDTDQYTGQDPSILDSYSLGITEFTNANYFSDETIPNNNPTPEHIFPYPQVNSTNTQICEDYAPGSTELRKYISRKDKGDCPPLSETRTADHFATPSLLNEDYLITNENISTLKLWLDDNVYNTYATELLPRAVGYSASLLNYFFRGQLAVVPVDSNNVKIQNLSKDTLNSGTIELYYDNTQNERIWLTTYSITTPIAQGQTTDAIYIIPPTDNKTPGRYWAVFNGKLGEEEGAVIGAFGYSWTEEWDNGLKGNHPWYTTMNDPTVIIPYGSTILAEVSNGILTQENMRPAGTTSSNQNWQLNTTRIGVDPYGSTAYLDAFPLPVTSDTEVRVKIDLINTNFPTPLPQCIYTNVNGAYQHILIVFNQTFSDGTTYIEFTVSGQQYNTMDTFRPVFITPGVEARINIYQELQRRGITFAEPLQIIRVNITQQFLPPCDTTTEDQQQLMQVDYIRIIDGTAMP